MSDDAPRPGSYASLEKRVAAVESTVAGLQRDLSHQGQLFDLRLETIRVTGEATKKAVEGIEDLIQRAFRGDETVAPRAAEERREWLRWRETVEARLDGQQAEDERFAGMKATWLAVLAVLGGIASLASIAYTAAKLTGAVG